MEGGTCGDGCGSGGSAIDNVEGSISVAVKGVKVPFRPFYTEKRKSIES